MRKNIISRFLFGTSLLAVISTGALATNVREIAAEEFSANKIATKLFSKTNDYLLNLDVSKESKEIAKKVRNGLRDRRPVPTVEQDATNEIKALLEAAKTSNQYVGGGYYLTCNARGDLSTISANNPLAYPALYASDREKGDAFLPRTYQGHFMGKKLWEEIDYYTSHLGLEKEDKTRLYHYLEPLYYLVQLELNPMIEGGKYKSLYNSKRWVYEKSYDQLLRSLKNQTDHHFSLIKNAHLRGLNETQVRNSLIPSLLDLGLAVLPRAERNLHPESRDVYKMGANRAGSLSLMHPHADNLPYPVLNEHRRLPGMNIPFDMGDSPALIKQWNRVNQFIRLNDYNFSAEERNTMSHVLQALGTLFHKHLSTFHVQRFPVGENYWALTEDMAISFINNYTIPEPYLTAFYNRDIDPDIHHVLAGIKSKGDTHRALTTDLWPRRLADEDRQAALVNEGIKFLMFKDILDRSELFNEYGDIIRMADMMAL